jgi:hypothetical protein
MNMGAAKVPELRALIDLWDKQYNSAVSTYDANTGEAPTAGTPYSQTALLNQVANSPFEYQREVWGIFLNEVLNDWILPYLTKRIKKAHYLVSEFSEEDLAIIDEAIHAKNHNKFMIDSLSKGMVPSPYHMAKMGQVVEKSLSAFGNKREIQIPDEFLNVKGKITANITGELKNKAAILQSLDSIFKTVAASYNPATGQYAALQDKTLSKIFGAIVEASGVPLSYAQLKAGPSAPVQQPDLSAVTPQAMPA